MNQGSSKGPQGRRPPRASGLGVLIARALAQEAPLIVMDEPTAGLDRGKQALVIREIARPAGSGPAMILSTHDPGHAFAIGTAVVLLHEGRHEGWIVARGPPGALPNAHRCPRLGVDVMVERVADGRSVCLPQHWPIDAGTRAGGERRCERGGSVLFFAQPCVRLTEKT